LVEHAYQAEIVSTITSEFGRKYVLEGPIASPDGRSPRLRSVWFVADGGDVGLRDTAEGAEEFAPPGTKADEGDFDFWAGGFGFGRRVGIGLAEEFDATEDGHECSNGTAFEEVAPVEVVGLDIGHRVDSPGNGKGERGGCRGKEEGK